MNRLARPTWKGLIFPALLFLSACAQLPPAPPAAHLLLPAEQRAQVLTSLQRWTANGQASLRSPQGSQSFGFIWRQEPQGAHLMILGPLGNTVAELQENEQQASLVEANGKRLVAASMGELLQRVLGVSLPVHELPDWLLGIPARGQVAAYDAEGLPRMADWGAWHLQYLHYEAVGGLRMPALLQATGPDGVQMRIAVSDWRLGQG